MRTHYSHLLRPLKVGKTIFRNRLFTAPITLHAMQGHEQYPTEGVITHFANKARGGAACVTCCGANIFPSDGSLPTSYDVYEKKNVHYLAQLAQAIHFHGARASMELGAVGLTRGVYTVCDGVRMISGKPGKQMPESEMNRIADGFAFAAEALKKADFDMILLHFGHGLPMGQFLSPLTNRRTDKYGGSLENRARFPMMVIDRIRERVGGDLLMEVRISGSEFEPGGIEIAEAIEFTKMVEDRIDLIHVSAGMHHPKWMTVVHPSDFLPPTPNVFLAEEMKKSGVNIPVVTIGGIQDLEGAEKILADGRADVVSIARGFIADPDLGKKALQGRGKDVIPCIKCMRCHDSVVWEYRYVCSANPVIGLEHKLNNLIQPPGEKQKVIVVGGGPAGMKAALVAAERGHEVTLYEKSDSLGGILKSTDVVAFKNGLKRFKAYLAYQVSKSSIQVRLNTEATPDLLAGEHADVIIAALGAAPVIPSIPGVEERNVLTALASYGREKQLGKKIVIVGGGQVGCETGLHLARMGREVTVLEMSPELAPDATQTHRTELLQLLDGEENLHYRTDARCTKISEHTVSFSDQNDTTRTIEADSVLLAVGMKEKQNEAESFRGAAGRFISIGDCVRAATVEHAIASAFYAAVHI